MHRKKYSIGIMIMVMIMIQPIKGMGLIDSLQDLKITLQSLHDALLEKSRKKPKPHISSEEYCGATYTDLPVEIQFEVIKNLIPSEISSADTLIRLMDNLEHLRLTNRMSKAILEDESFLKTIRNMIVQRIPHNLIFNEMWNFYRSAHINPPFKKMLQDIESMVGFIEQLMMAVLNGRIQDAKATLGLLKDFTKDDFISNIFVDDEPLLMVAIKDTRRLDYERLTLTRELLKAGADVNVQSDKSDIEKTPLIAAVYLADPKLRLSFVKLLLEYSPNLALTNKYGKTALDIARDKGYQDVVQIIESWQRRQGAKQEGEGKD